MFLEATPTTFEFELLVEKCGHFVLIHDLIQSSRPSALKLAERMMYSTESVIVSPSKTKMCDFVEKMLEEAEKSYSQEARELLTSFHAGNFQRFCRQYLQAKL